MLAVGGTLRLEKLLLLDTVGSAPGAVLTGDGQVVAAAEFAGRFASTMLLGEIRRMLQESGWALKSLSGIGVVAGPGSFTGVRTGLATAKGLCEAAGIPLAAVSSLAVLAEAGDLRQRFAVMNAGRGALYVREERGDGTAGEWMSGLAEFEQIAAGAAVVTDEQETAARIGALSPRVCARRVVDMLPLVRRVLAEGGTDRMWADANYVGPESAIYRRQPSAEAHRSGGER